jgi:serine/threonine protein kinase
LHENKILHRDIKPENLIYDSEGYLYLTDLGIAKLYDPDNPLKDSSGTPCYMAPEVIQNMNNEFVSDYYAIGIIVHELMFGKVNIFILNNIIIFINRDRILVIIKKK